MKKKKKKGGRVAHRVSNIALTTGRCEGGVSKGGETKMVGIMEYDLLPTARQDTRKGF